MLFNKWNEEKTREIDRERVKKTNKNRKPPHSRNRDGKIQNSYKISTTSHASCLYQHDDVYEMLKTNFRHLFIPMLHIMCICACLFRTPDT